VDIRNQEFQLFFSGVESGSWFDVVSKETNTMLVSFLYLRKQGKKFLREAYARRPDLQLMIDSGAHTFIEKEEEYTDKEPEYWEKYLSDYSKFLLENKEHIYAAVELDIEGLVGEAKVEEWREKYFKPLEEAGINIIYVWHTIRGEKQWEQMCKRFKYVGFSYKKDLEMLTPSFLQRMFNIAKRHNTLVHGFAVTGLEMMEKYPFKTVDSTTYLVGTQYGELNYFDGRKMTRLKKNKWKTLYKNKLIRLGANWELAGREQPYELVRINVLTFLEVEKYVRRRLKNKSYWLSGQLAPTGKPKRKIVKVGSTNEPPIERGKIPDREWFEGEMEDYPYYAKCLGIDLKLDKEEILNHIKTFYNFIIFNKEAIEKFYTDEILFSYCDIFKIPGINTRKKAIEALSFAFKQHALGERHEFEKISEEPEGAQKPKERESYYQEPEFTTVELDEKECTSLLAGFLPEPGGEMPEVEAYDTELKRIGIEVVRDEKGRFLKGQQRIRKRKKLYDDNLPKLSCDVCTKGQHCHDYRAGYVCAYNKLFKKFDTRSKEDIIDAIVGICDLSVERMLRGAAMEVADGGMIDPAVSAEMDRTLKHLLLVKDLEGMGSRIVAQRKVVMEDGRTTTVETVAANPQQGSLLNRLFGNMNSNEAADDDTIDITVDDKKP
jgi:hypothetical protein